MAKTHKNKRQKIKQSNQTMFIWVATASVVVSFAAVASYFFYLQIVFNAKVISEKEDTVKVLEKSNSAVSELRNNIYALEANENLREVKKDDERAVQVVIDALPADANSLALGASIEEVLSDVPNVSVESLTTEPVGSEVDANSVADDAEAGQVNFRMVVKSKGDDPTPLRDMLQKFEKSIRVVDVDLMTLNRSGGRFEMIVEGHAYYEPAKKIQLEEKVVRP